MGQSHPQQEPAPAVLSHVEIHFLDGDVMELDRCAHLASPLGNGAVIYAFRLQGGDEKEFVVHSKDVRMLVLTPALVAAH